MKALDRYRSFSKEERDNRDAWTTSRMQNDCEGCEEHYAADGSSIWTPAEQCPVHGANFAKWWNDLNRELDDRWPGEWQTAA